MLIDRTAERTALDVTNAVSWTSSRAGVAPVSNGLDEEGLVKGKGVGTAEIVAALKRELPEIGLD